MSYDRNERQPRRAADFLRGNMQELLLDSLKALSRISNAKTCIKTGDMVQLSVLFPLYEDEKTVSSYNELHRLLSNMRDGVIDSIEMFDKAPPEGKEALGPRFELDCEQAVQALDVIIDYIQADIVYRSRTIYGIELTED